MILLIGMMIGYQLRRPSEKMDFTGQKSLRLGTYTTDIEEDGYVQYNSDYYLDIVEYNSKFELYKRGEPSIKPYDKGTVECQKDNTFLLKGEKNEYYVFKVDTKNIVLFGQVIDCWALFGKA